MKTFPLGATRPLGLLLGLVFTALFSSPLLAVDCTPDAIDLSTQSDVDDFQADHGPCDRVVGLLTIDGATIENVDGLSALTTAGDSIRFLWATALTNVDGLSSLTSVDGYLFFTDSDSLTNVDGLSSLTSVAGEVYFAWNVALTDLDGLSALSSAGDLILEGNTVLANVDGLSNLVSVDGDINFWSNFALTNVDGLSNLTSVGEGLFLFGNFVLTNVDGLSALISVGTDVDIQFNPVLEMCSGLTALLDQVDDGAPGPGPGGAGIPDVGGNVVMGDNLPGCNSIEEIIPIRLVNLTVDILDLEEAGELTKGIANALVSKLNSALIALEEEDIQTVCDVLQAFINSVEAQYDKKISAVDADYFILETEAIRDLLGCK